MADRNGKLKTPSLLHHHTTLGKKNQTRYSNELMQHPNINQRTRQFSHN